MTFSDLTELYTEMDQAWDQVARAYGFVCNGCRDNCCTSLFFHHTQVENAYLAHGFSQHSPGVRKAVLERARQYVDLTFNTDALPEGREPESLKLLCPANQEGRCLLYAFRPMICRLHGLPHELHRPGAPVLKGPGCTAGAFESRDYIPFDRTPFYRKMAAVEMAFRRKTKLSGRVRLTVAQILLQT